MFAGLYGEVVFYAASFAELPTVAHEDCVAPGEGEQVVADVLFVCSVLSCKDLEGRYDLVSGSREGVLHEVCVLALLLFVHT